MATFVSLLSYTPQGIAAIKDSPKRLDQAREAFAGMGVTIKEVYLTMGEHDLMIITEAADAETAAKAILMIGAQGNVSSTTVQAFDEDSYREIIGALM
jgi:uncharacterized protein with GYD domain